MSHSDRAKGCLVGLACGDALGRPVEFRSPEQIERQHGTVTEMLANGTHGQPAGTITDDTEMALCVAESLVEHGGFQPDDIGERFVGWLESGPFDIGLMTRDALTHIQQGTPWHKAGVEVWENRREGSNAGNGSIMRCAPHALAFRHFTDELTHVSRLSSAITHADPRCQWGCALLNQTIAKLILDGEASSESAIRSDRRAPDELLTAISDVKGAITGNRSTDEFEAHLGSSGYVVESLQTALYHGLASDSFEQAVVKAVNSGGDTDTIGAITGAIAGARFGIEEIPDGWIEEVDEANRTERLSEELMQIRRAAPEQDGGRLSDDEIVFKDRTIRGPAYIEAYRYQGANIGHRPEPAPHRAIQTEYQDIGTPEAAMMDWERRAYAVDCGRCLEYLGPRPLPDDEMSLGPMLVPFPQYPFADSFHELPGIDQRRIMRDAEEAGKALIQAYAALAEVRHPILQAETEDLGIGRIDPLAGATRILVRDFGNAVAILSHQDVGGDPSADEIRSGYDVRRTQEIAESDPEQLQTALTEVDNLTGRTEAVLDYVTHLCLAPANSEEYDMDGAEERFERLRESARNAVGQLQVAHASLRRGVVRHPEL